MTSYNVHLLFHNTGRLIQTNSGAREHLLFEIPAGTRKTMGTDAVIRTDWSTFTSVIGPTVKGNSTRLFLSFFVPSHKKFKRHSMTLFYCLAL